MLALKTDRAPSFWHRSTTSPVPGNGRNSYMQNAAEGHTECSNVEHPLRRPFLNPEPSFNLTAETLFQLSSVRTVPETSQQTSLG